MVVNLNKVRKARARAAAEQDAAENRIRFGRTKSEKVVEAARQERLARDVDAHKRKD